MPPKLIKGKNKFHSIDGMIEHYFPCWNNTERTSRISDPQEEGKQLAKESIQRVKLKLANIRK